MSTNNNRLGKEIKPIWRNEDAARQKILKLSGSKVQALATNDISECNAVTLSERGIVKIEDFMGFTDKLHRLDLSGNQITRLHGFNLIPAVSLLNVSSNKLQGDASLEDLRYLTELRTLNIGNNPGVKHIRSHVVKPLKRLQALIAHECGFEKVSFLKFLPSLSTLVLSKNSISDFSPKEVGSLSMLTKLSLGHNHLQHIPDLRACSQLTELRINHNFIKSIDEAFIGQVPKLKTLDVSHNFLTEWDQVRFLSRLGGLTNLTIKGNKFPTPPESVDEIEVREDKAAETIEDANERRYRHMVLSIFQKLVGAAQKPFVQLIVLDMKRVKTKWRPGMGQGAGDDENPKRAGEKPSQKGNNSKQQMLPDKQKRKDQHHELPGQRQQHSKQQQHNQRPKSDGQVQQGDRSKQKQGAVDNRKREREQSNDSDDGSQNKKRSARPWMADDEIGDNHDVDERFELSRLQREGGGGGILSDGPSHDAATKNDANKKHKNKGSDKNATAAVVTSSAQSLQALQQQASSSGVRSVIVHKKDAAAAAAKKDGKKNKDNQTKETTSAPSHTQTTSANTNTDTQRNTGDDGKKSKKQKKEEKKKQKKGGDSDGGQSHSVDTTEKLSAVLAGQQAQVFGVGGDSAWGW